MQSLFHNQFRILENARDSSNNNVSIAYFRGESLRNAQKFLKLQGVNINNTAYRWIKKYVALMQAYSEKITPNVSDAWRADELYLKVLEERTGGKR